jgi:hypothetical protein
MRIPVRISRNFKEKVLSFRSKDIHDGFRAGTFRAPW